MRHIFTILLCLSANSITTAQDNFDYQFFRFNTQYLYEDPAPISELQSPILGMNITLDEFDLPNDPIPTYESLFPTEAGSRFSQIVPAFAGLFVTQANGFTQLDFEIVGGGPITIQNQASVGSSWEAGENISARVDSIRQEDFLGLTDSVKYIRFYQTDSGEELAVPIRVSKSYGLLTGTYFWQLEQTTTPLQLIGVSDPAVGSQNATLDNVLDIPNDKTLSIERVRSFMSRDGTGYFTHQEQKVWPGSFSCDPIFGTREIEFFYDELSYEVDFESPRQRRQVNFSTEQTGFWRLSEEDHGWLDGQPGELYFPENGRTAGLIFSDRFGCYGVGKQYVYVDDRTEGFIDLSDLDFIPTGFYFPNLGGPYFTNGTFSQYLNNLEGVVSSQTDTCGVPYDFTNPLDSVVLGTAFDWQLFRPGVQYLYEKPDLAEPAYLGMRLNGIGEEPAYESLREVDSRFRQRVPSFAGLRVEQQPAGTTLLFYTDTMHLRTGAQTGTQWIAMDSTLATVDSVKLESFFGLTDSVKYISFEQRGNAKPLDIRISKNYGLLTGTYFYDLEANASLPLVGLSQPMVGIQAPSFASLTSFEAGDEYHIRLIETFDDNAPVSYRITETKAIVESVDRVGDSLVFVHILKDDLQFRGSRPTSGYSDSIYRESRTETIAYDLQQQPWMGSQIGQFLPLTINGETESYSIARLSENSFCSGPVLQLEAYQPSTEEGAFELQTFSWNGEYFDGLAGPFNRYVEGSHLVEELLFYDKAGCSDGIPLDFNGLIDGVNDFIPDERIRLYPNPAKTQIFLEVPTDLGALSIRFFSGLGRQVAFLPASTGDRTIRLQSLPPGVYTVLLSGPGGPAGRKRVVIKK